MHEVIEQLKHSTPPPTWKVFLFNKKTAFRALFGDVLLSVILIPMGYVVLTGYSNDTEATILGSFMLLFGMIMFINLIRHLYWLKTKDSRKIIITDKQIVSQWGKKVISWNINDVQPIISAVRSRNAGRSVGLDLFDSSTKKRRFLTKDHWIGNTDMVKYEIEEKKKMTF